MIDVHVKMKVLYIHTNTKSNKMFICSHRKDTSIMFPWTKVYLY
jgi:hypothetical protein